MKIQGFDIFGYEIPMEGLGVRKGMIIRIRDETGREAFGEVAPLEGFSHESFEESLDFLRQVRQKLLHQDLQPVPLPPSVMFGIESALMQLQKPLEKDLQFTLSHLDYGRKDSRLDEEIVKVKLGDLELDEAISVTRSYKEKGIPLRIDLNRKWPLEKSVAFCSSFSTEDIVYIEEPTKYFMELETFYEKTGFSYALDEHLLYHPIDRILKLKGLTHLILKPMMQGGLTCCSEIVQRRPDITCVFSSSYETDVGLMHIARIASILNPERPLGIDTIKLMQDRVLTQSIDYNRGVIPHEQFNKMSLDYDKLEASMNEWLYALCHRQYPLEPAIYFEDRSLSYKELYSLAEKRKAPSSIFYTGDPLETVITILSLIQQGKKVFPVNPKEPHLPKIENLTGEGFCLMTSGTTAEPKVALLDTSSYVLGSIYAAKQLKISPGDRWLFTMPLYHTAGISVLFRIFCQGGALVFPSSPIEPTHISFVPTQLKRFLQNPRTFPELKMVLIGGQRTPEALFKEAWEMGLPVHNVYGMTEMASAVTIGEYHPSNGVHVGQPLAMRK